MRIVVYLKAAEFLHQIPAQRTCLSIVEDFLISTFLGVGDMLTALAENV